MIQRNMYNNDEWWLCHKYHVSLYDHAKQNDNECSSHVMNSNNGSCMAIYLGMAMEMP